MSTIGTLCIRADANPSIGMGHVMRCLALAQAWQDRGGDVCLISALRLPALIARMQAEKLELVPMTAEPGSTEDQALTVATARQKGARWIVLDGYFFTAGYMLDIQRSGFHLLLLDDVADRDLGGVESILNQNAYASPELYARFQPGPHLLLGCPHTLLRRDFLEQRGSKLIPETGTRVLVTMGGADPANVTQLVMKSLAIASSRSLDVRIIVGAANSHLAALQHELTQLQTVHHAEILVNPPDMPGQMAWSDVTITAAGSSCWELFCLGVPSIVLQTSDDQKFMSPWFSKHGVAEVMGLADEFQPEDLARQVETMLADAELRSRLSSAASAIIDGQGAARVVDFMLTRS